jgi:hypothetical protein
MLRLWRIAKLGSMSFMLLTVGIALITQSMGFLLG